MTILAKTPARTSTPCWLWAWLALVFAVLNAPTQAGEVTYIYTDAQGTPIAEADANGNITARFDYMPYGAPVPGMGTAPEGPGYTGHVNDPDTGLVYMQARYYDPAVGRFMSVDPVGPSPGNTFNFNRYAYANNNPYRYIDPYGRQSYEDLNLTGMAASEMLRNGDMTEAEHLDAWAQGAAAGAKGLAIGATIAIPGPENIAIAVPASRLLLAVRASKGISQALRYVESVAERIGPTGGRSGIRTVEYSGKGGEKGAAKLFDTLTGGKSAPRDGGRLGKLSDGSHVQMSTKTHADGTIETSVRIMSDRTGSHIKDVNKIRFKH